MTPKIHDIFTRKHPIIKKEVPKIPIEIDYREKNSLVPANLEKLGFGLNFKELKVADYIVKGVAIERKTVNDFISSMISRRLITQLEQMQQYERKLLIVEGINEQELYHENSKVNENAIRGMLLSILLKYNIPIIFTKNSEDSAKFMKVLANKKESETPLNPRRKSLNKKEQMQFIIESFPGVGPKTAKKLLQEFGSIKKIINSSEEELSKILGTKAKNFSLLAHDIYHD